MCRLADGCVRCVYAGRGPMPAGERLLDEGLLDQRSRPDIPDDERISRACRHGWPMSRLPVPLTSCRRPSRTCLGARAIRVARATAGGIGASVFRDRRHANRRPGKAGRPACAAGEDREGPVAGAHAADAASKQGARGLTHSAGFTALGSHFSFSLQDNGRSCASVGIAKAIRSVAKSNFRNAVLH